MRVLSLSLARILALLLTVTGGASLGDDATVRTVVLGGQAAPGVTDGLFDSFPFTSISP